MPYASETTVSVEKSRVEIETLLVKHGASAFMSGFSGEKAFVQFQLKNRFIRFVLRIPAEEEFSETLKGRTRSLSDRRAVYEQVRRQRWRALLLVIKAKLEAVEAGVATFEQEFLAHILLPNSQTVGEWLEPQIRAAYNEGKMPPMLPGIGETHTDNAP